MPRRRGDYDLQLRHSMLRLRPRVTTNAPQERGLRLGVGVLSVAVGVGDNQCPAGEGITTRGRRGRVVGRGR